MRCLVTAGNTREPIDRVRDWGNIFTGNTGYRIAAGLSTIGEVDLLTSNRVHLEVVGSVKFQHNVIGSAFSSYTELKASLAALLARRKYDAIFMTAAVADYTPDGVYQIVQRAASSDRPGVETWTVQN